MADLYLSEHAHIVSGDGTYQGPFMPQPALAVQKIAIGAATQSNAFSSKTRAVMIVADGACHYQFGTDPTASTSTMFLPANTPVIFGVAPGYKISVST